MEIQNVELDLVKKCVQEVVCIKFEFLVNMFYELCILFNGVIGFICLMLKIDFNVMQCDYLIIIECLVNNLLVIINDVFDFFKLEVGKLILESILFLLCILFDEVVILLVYFVYDKGLELMLNIKNNVLDNVIGDLLCLQQIVINFVGNVIKFIEYGNIDVLVEQWVISNFWVQIEIQIYDIGIGIFECDQFWLFQVFCQVDVSILCCYGGIGFGLVIIQCLVKEMGGDILFYSQLNCGFIFWFYISFDFNLNVILDMLNIDGFVGKCLVYVEVNVMVVQCILEMLVVMLLEVIYSFIFFLLVEVQYDILLVGILVLMCDLLLYWEKLVKVCVMFDNVLLVLLCYVQVSVEVLKCDGVVVCLLKLFIIICLLLVLVVISYVFVFVLLMQIDSYKLLMMVMVVDDNLVNLKLIGVLLDDFVQQVIFCDSGQQVVDKVKQLQMDLILMDIQMLDMDGICVCEFIYYLFYYQ